MRSLLSIEINRIRILVCVQITDLKGNTQEDAIDIGGILPFEDEGDTSTHTNNFDGVIAKGCAIATNAPDVFYEAFFTSNVDVTIDVCSDDFDTVLFVYQLGAESNPLLNKVSREELRVVKISILTFDV